MTIPTFLLRIPMFLGILLLVCAPPRTAGAEGIRLDTKAIDELFAEWDRTDSPGCSLAVIHDGDIVYARGYGMANLDWSIANSATTVFRIGSTSKQITAACIALLSVDGVISLDDEIRKYLPEMPEYESPITVRHLIHHTSGVRDYLGLMTLVGKRKDDWYTTGEALAIICQQRNLNFTPGERHLYSNSGYLLLGIIVERASGKTLREFAAGRIFKPLGMRHTHFHDDHTEVARNRALGYSHIRGSAGFRIDVTTLDMVGDGGVFTSVEDFFLWDQNFYHAKVGGKKFLELIQTPGVLNDGEQLEYAFGLGIDEHRGLRMVAHSGGFVGYRAQMIRFPEQKFSVICFANLGTISPSRLCREVANICLADVFPEEKRRRGGDKDARPLPAAATVELSRQELEAVTGTYADEEWNVMLELLLEGAGLAAKFRNSSYRLRPVSANRFQASAEGEPPVELEVRRENGEVAAVSLLRPGREPLELLHREPFKPTAAELASFAGHYHSEELLKARYEIVLGDGGLVLKIGARPEQGLTPRPGDLFVTSRGLKLRFQRHEDGILSGFQIDAGRVNGISFMRVKD